METLESSRVCRLCGKQSGISINIFDKNESHVKKINAILPIMVHEMDLLPKHMCHRCSYKLEEFHNFYVDCLKTDANLKGQLSWMRKEDPKERVGVPMVHIENINMKVEPPDYDVYDVNPMVDNVDYISSVTFPVNGVQSNEIPEQITYTAYTRCGCYCDNADQSNQPVPAKYDNRISRCSSVQNNVKPHSHSCANRLAIVPDFPDEAPEKSSVVRFNNNDRKACDSTSSTLNPSKIKSSKNKKASKNTRIVRNLRPRRESVDYVGRKKKHVALSSDKSDRSMNVTRIKAEELNHFHGHMLRPRKGFVDYLGPKRKYRRSATKNQRSQSDGNGSAENKVRNIASKLQLPPKEVPNLWKSRAMLNVKTEQLTDFEEATLDEPISSAVLSLNEDSDVKSKIETLPNFDASQQDDRVNHNAFDYPRSSDGRFLSTDNWKPLRSVSKRKSKSEKIKSNRTNKTNKYPLKNLRSQNSCLRNGKVIKIDNGEALRKLRKNHRNLPGKGRTVGKNLMPVVSGTVAERKMSASSTKLIEIKHYCETCNSRFVNKELFKLHACYGHSFYLHNRG